MFSPYSFNVVSMVAWLVLCGVVWNYMPRDVRRLAQNKLLAAWRHYDAKALQSQELPNPIRVCGCCPSPFRCALCDCGGEPLPFEMWRQMTVEHLIGKSQQGYLKDIRGLVRTRFPESTESEQ